ncbi:GyrI-like domain-containing protein [Myceligenerans salitolerans]|uniref:GyrI-like domain-containing protein n=1 Tax=Myceligenerans salitolerans TaxID=1230528 RepID=A0ABS3IDT3_9MICO|nr:GyrI-like domain-containing protein [Myceligenerans salitolerans]MBO0611200.1 GyrI-like domain-containing protein [Myceligenerans salitolerans]
MTVDPVITTRPASPYVGWRRTIHVDQFPEVADKIPVTLEWLEEHGVTVNGAPFFRYHVVRLPDHVDVSCCIPVEGESPVGPGMVADVLPAGRYASVRHVGHPDELVELTAELVEWGTSTGRSWDVTSDGSDDVWSGRVETYFSPPDVPIEQWETEVAIRLAD